MCMIGMDVNAPEADLVGFAIEVQAPNSTDFVPLRNRLAFAYPPGTGVTGARQFDSTEAPFQKFRWIHFPKDPQAGIYHYRVTKMHMPTDGQLVKGLANTLPISLDPVTYDGKIDVGFTRNFASSQAYAERADNRGDILPATVDEGLQFVKPPGTSALYEWLGFEGRKLVFDFLEDGIDDPNDFEIADFTRMWFIFSAAEQDLPFLKAGQPVAVSIPSLPGETLKAPIASIDPNLDEGDRKSVV